MNSIASEPVGGAGQQNASATAKPQLGPQKSSGTGEGVSMAAGIDGKLVLRVLTGANQGARVRMRAERMLIGNLESECDVVLDVGSTERHACLIRTSLDGWSVLVIAGDLWVDRSKVEVQQSATLLPGQVLTLGATAFCVGDPTVVDWSTLQIPDNLGTATEDQGMVPLGHAAGDAEIVPVVPASEPRWQLAKRITAVMVVLVVLALLTAGYFYLAPFLSKPVPTVDNSQRISALRTVLRSQAWSQELGVQADPDRSDLVLLSGYLKERGQTKQLETLLSQQGLRAEHRWVSIAELSKELSHRLGLQSDSALEYAHAGSFHMLAPSSAVAQYDRLVHRAMQDMPAITAFDMQVMDLGSSDERAPTVHYERVGSEVVVSGLDAIRPAAQYQIQEVHLGALPSVVMSDGARYFEGASLPGNAVLQKIGGDHIIVQTATQERRIDFGTNTPVLRTAPSRGTKARSEEKLPAVPPVDP